jgi:hypothetical protein
MEIHRDVPCCFRAFALSVWVLDQRPADMESQNSRMSEEDSPDGADARFFRRGRLDSSAFVQFVSQALKLASADHEVGG